MEGFRDRVRRGERLLGAFIKTPSVHATEILGGIGFDFLVVDQEHGPFDAAALDMLALAGRAGGAACLVPGAAAAPPRRAGALHRGAAGGSVPQGSPPEPARAAARACRHREGYRGFTTSSRAGGYGAIGMAEHVEAADRNVTVVAMIEDAAALDHLDEILTTPGVDAILVGRADLAISLGETSVAAPAVARAVDRVLQACRRLDLPAFIFAGEVAEAAPFAERGATGFIIGSDQGLLRTAALEVQARFRAEIARGAGPKARSEP